MDRFVIGGPLYWLGWLSTAAMTLSVIAMGVGFFNLRPRVPDRGAAFFVPLRRAGTVPGAGVRNGPGSAAHHAAKSHSASKTRVNALMALRCVRGTWLT